MTPDDSEHRKQKTAVRDLLISVTSINSILRDDLNVAMAALQVNPSNTALRGFIRTFFAYVEGTLFGFSQAALTWDRQSRVLLAGEQLLLREVAPEIDSRGNLRERPRFNDVCARVRFTSKALQKVLALPESALVNFSTDGWNQFQQAVVIRNAITHPKNAEDLLISPNDDGQGSQVDCISLAAQWYGEESMKLWFAVSDAVQKQLRPPPP